MHRQQSLTDLLAVSTVLTYAVLVTGAALGSASGADACLTWTCLVGGEFSGTLLLAVAHYLSTALAGLALGGAFVIARRRTVDRAVRIGTAAAALLFIFQMGVGILVQSGSGAWLHLPVAVVVFMAILLTLGRALAAESQHTDVDSPSSLTASSSPTLDSPSPSSQPIQSRTLRTRARARAYLELTKPRLMWLLSLLALAGMALAAIAGHPLDGVTVVATLAGGVLAVGASGTFNHVVEYNRDRKMSRTADRPVATAQIPRTNATVFGVMLLVTSTVVMGGLVNRLAALLTLVAVAYYSVIYTIVLKPNTSWNIAIGGGAGALPALIGWAAVTGSVGLPALVLAGVVVVWTPAHFYNLGIVYRDDYERAGYPIYPVVSGVTAARSRILFTLGLTLLTTAVLAAVAPLGWLFAFATVAVGGVFLATVVSQHRRRTDTATLRSFHASNAYLGVVLLAIVTEAAVAFL